VIAECGLLVGGILLVLGVALSLTNYMVDAEVPDQLVEGVRQSIHSRWAFLLALNAVLPLFAVLAAALAVVTYWSWLSTGLPALFK
jgi:TRAP-type C4-dicarboxylate transport system permease large subunit